MNMRTGFYLMIIIGLLLIPACNEVEIEVDPEQDVTKAIAVLHPLDNSGVSGIVYFEQTGLGLNIVADIDGLEQGNHGFHIHQYGDLRTEDGSALGGHYDPENKPHGGPTTDDQHAGDLGNIYAVGDTLAHFEGIQIGVSLTSVNPILGRSVVIHSAEDDMETQPSGNSGKRIAAGIIGIANIEL